MARHQNRVAGRANPRQMLLTLASRHRPEAVPAGNPSAFMAGGAWGSSDPPVNGNSLSRFATRTVRHPPPHGGAVKYSHGSRRHDHAQEPTAPCC